MNPIPRDRNNIGKLSSSRYISLISSDIASLSYGLPLHEIDRQQNLCHPRIFSKCIVFTIRKISLQICYHDDVLLWRSDYAGVDLHFLPLLKPLFTWESNHLHMGLLFFFQMHMEYSTRWESIGNIFRKLPCNCQSRINSKVTDHLNQLYVDVSLVVSSQMNKYFRILCRD